MGTGKTHGKPLYSDTTYSRGDERYCYRYTQGRVPSGFIVDKNLSHGTKRETLHNRQENKKNTTEILAAKKLCPLAPINACI